MTFREGTQEAPLGAPSAAPRALGAAEQPEAPVAIEEEAEERSRPVVFEPSAASRGEDPFRLYLKEIGNAPLRTAAQEVEIGRRIEAGQISLRNTHPGIPTSRGPLRHIA